MNIVYIHTHDTGRYIEPYGYNIPTPNLMQLAKEGTLFRSSFCTAPTCSPSRASLLTGMSPHAAGMFGLAHRGFKLNDYNKHIANFLGDNGYETALCGVQHVAPSADMIGYHRLLDNKSSSETKSEKDIINAQIAAEYIKENHDSPFFLSFGMENTHREFPEIDKSINPDYVQVPFPLYDNYVNREEMSHYISSAMVVDESVGIVLNALNESGLDNETFVIFTTDHGIPFPRMKCNLYDTGIGVSLILRFPANKLAGKATDALVSHLDIYPTICDILGVKEPDWLEGFSLLPLLKKEVENIRDEVYAEINYHAAYEPLRCIRTDRYKYIRYFDDYKKIMSVNIDDSHSKDFLISNGYLGYEQKKEYLFDLYLDPVERVNLLGNPDYIEVYNNMKKRMKNWMKRTDDPLLTEDRIEKPNGAIINERSCLSNTEQKFEK